MKIIAALARLVLAATAARDCFLTMGDDLYELYRQGVCTAIQALAQAVHQISLRNR